MVWFKKTEAGTEDPGVRDQIFLSMEKDDKKHMKVADFITSDVLLSCDSQWTEKVYHNFKDYVM